MRYSVFVSTQNKEKFAWLQISYFLVHPAAVKAGKRITDIWISSLVMPPLILLMNTCSGIISPLILIFGYFSLLSKCWIFKMPRKIMVIFFFAWIEILKKDSPWLRSSSICKKGKKEFKQNVWIGSQVVRTKMDRNSWWCYRKDKLVLAQSKTQSRIEILLEKERSFNTKDNNKIAY